MKRQVAIFAAIILGVLVLMAGTLQATEKPSAAVGEKLFNDPALSGSGNAKSCGTCHPKGKGLKDAGSNPKLANIINSCIKGALGGQALPEDSMQMQSIKLYIESLKEEK